MGVSPRNCLSWVCNKIRIEIDLLGNFYSNLTSNFMFVESNTFKNGLILWFFNFIFSTSLYFISQKYWILTN